MEIIELDDSSESESEHGGDLADNSVGRRAPRRKQAQQVTYEESPDDDGDYLYDDDSENEFEG